MSDFVEAANLLRALIRKMQVSKPENPTGTYHLDVDITESEMERLLEWGTADANAGAENSPEIE
jgi:hypothetical protein